MDVRPLPANVAAAVLDATASISSNYDRALVLTEVVERGGLTRGQPARRSSSLVQSMSSSYDKRRVLTAVVDAGRSCRTAVAGRGDQGDRSSIELVRSGGNADQADRQRRPDGRIGRRVLPVGVADFVVVRSVPRAAQGGRSAVDERARCSRACCGPRRGSAAATSAPTCSKRSRVAHKVTGTRGSSMSMPTNGHGIVRRQSRAGRAGPLRR